MSFSVIINIKCTIEGVLLFGTKVECVEFLVVCVCKLEVWNQPFDERNALFQSVLLLKSEVGMFLSLQAF